MQKYILRDWSVVSDSKPELASRKLRGKVYGNPSFEDGSEITTSRISNVNGREIVCISGSIYVLEGEPNSEYTEWCAKNGYTIDAETGISCTTKTILEY